MEGFPFAASSVMSDKMLASDVRSKTTNAVRDDNIDATRTVKLSHSHHTYITDVEINTTADLHQYGLSFRIVFSRSGSAKRRPMGVHLRL